MIDLERRSIVYLPGVGPKKAELLEKLEFLIKIVSSTLEKLSDENLKKEYPTEALGYKMTTEYFLIHLLSHLSYHLGQINYHRRLLDI